MHWYGGSIAEAVNLSKQKNAIFVVFVEDENELSAEMAATLDDTAVVSRLSDQATFLAVKLKSGSVNYTHFAQIYQFVPVPSLFFIGRNGTPLEVVCAGVQPQNLATRIDRILEEHYKDKLSDVRVQPSTSSQNIKEQTMSFLQSEAAPVPSAPSPDEDEKPAAEREPDSPTPPKVPKTDHHEVTKSGREYEVVCDGDVCVRRPAGEPGPSHAPTPTPPATPEVQQDIELEPTESAASIEARLLRAQELIEAKRREKADKDNELEKEKEIERRTTGKGVAELKRWQADQELKHIQEGHKREKMENNLARQRILEQIAQDRAERRARDTPQPAQPQQPAPAPAPAAAAAAAAATAPATSGDAGSRARIQFKLPDGTSHTAHFDADGTLETVHRYVSDNLQMSASSFTLWTAFPRRELTDSTATLRALELAPSAALLVLPTRAAPILARPSAMMTVITFLTQIFTSFIFEPSHQIFTWLRTRLFPPPPAARAASPGAPPPLPPPGPGIRRRGNIHRIPNDRTSDDENNTWNGNSTQQM